MASVAISPNYNTKKSFSYLTSSSSYFPFPRTITCRKKQQSEDGEISLPQMGRREVILRSSEMALLGAIFSFSGTKPNYLGVQKSFPHGGALALCPATNNCISTSENISDLTHYAPPWNYNPEEKRGKVSREIAMKELVEVIKSTKSDHFTPKVVEKKDDYVRVEYASPIFGFVDDVEFWFPAGKKAIVQYRSASRVGCYDLFGVNRKRIKALRLALEKKGWSSDDSV
ncbi:unnamed protein product [Cuscuta campestris]|uniref:DUF1499 domain-containing protein n=1 Tax=Cuscuta campestris TaxID=132261 RepID=A0A484M6Q8_9ASTE|nr:unnamed protein product [Cuscuta campestris]